MRDIRRTHEHWMSIQKRSWVKHWFIEALVNFRSNLNPQFEQLDKFFKSKNPCFSLHRLKSSQMAEFWTNQNTGIYKIHYLLGLIWSTILRKWKLLFLEVLAHHYEEWQLNTNRHTVILPFLRPYLRGFTVYPFPSLFIEKFGVFFFWK